MERVTGLSRWVGSGELQSLARVWKTGVYYEASGRATVGRPGAVSARD